MRENLVKNGNKVSSKRSVWLYILILFCVLTFYISVNGLYLYDFKKAGFKEWLIILVVLFSGFFFLPYTVYKKLIRISVDEHKVYLSNLFHKRTILIKDLLLEEKYQFTRYGASGEYFIMKDAENGKEYKIEKFSIRNYDEILGFIKQQINSVNRESTSDLK